MASLIEQITEVPANNLENPALIQTGGVHYTMTYDELNNRITEVASQLRMLGLKEGSVCCVSMGNSPCFVAVFLAILKIKGTVAPVNPALKQNELRFVFEDMDVDLLVGPRGFYQSTTDLAQASNGHACGLAECYWDGSRVRLDTVRVPKGRCEKQGTGDDFVALALHTSGTTGNPKAVPLLESNLLASAKNVQDAYDLTRVDRSVLIMPLFHIHGIVAGMLAPLLCGSCIIIPERGLGHTFWYDFVTYKATWWTATPTHHKVILSLPLPPEGTLPRFIRSCSSPLDPSLCQQLEIAFKAPVLEAYAMTENAHHIASSTVQGPRKAGSVGLPCPALSLKVVDEDENPVGPDKKGEIVIKGPSVMRGYHDNPEANQKAFTRDGFFRTGDQGKIDEDGHLYITGRLKELINKGGEKVAPNEIDNVVLQHEDVHEAVTFSIPDDMYGENVGIAIVAELGKDLKSTTVKAWLRQRLAAFKVPRDIWIVDSIAKTATGKIQRSVVAESVLMDYDERQPALEGLSTLRAMWGHVLDIEEFKIGEADDFFLLGGDSVAAIRLANEARSQGWAFSTASVFRYPTLNDMAKALALPKQTRPTRRLEGSVENTCELLDSCADACAVDCKDISDIQPLTPMQQRFASLNRASGLWVASLPFKCDDVSLSQLEACVAVLRQRNPILRARTVCVRDSFYNVVVDDDAVWETASSLDDYVSRLSTLRILYGCSQARYGYIEDEHLGTHFVLTFTHTITDAWSRKLLYQQLEQGLQNLETLSSSSTPAPFSRFAELVANIDRNEAEMYYSACLSGFNRWSYLDPVHSGPEFYMKSIKTSVSLAKEVREGIITTEKVHLAWILALGAISGEDRVLALSTSSGRLVNLAGTEEIMGPMAALIPVSVDLSACATIMDGIDQVCSALFDSVPYEALAGIFISKHFGHTKREALLNFSEIADVNGMKLRSRQEGSLTMRLDRSTLFGRMNFLLHVRVTQAVDNNLQLLAEFESPALEEEKVQDLVNRFAHYLRAVHHAVVEEDMKALRASYINP